MSRACARSPEDRASRCAGRSIAASGSSAPCCRVYSAAGLRDKPAARSRRAAVRHCLRPLRRRESGDSCRSRTGAAAAGRSRHRRARQAKASRCMRSRARMPRPATSQTANRSHRSNAQRPFSIMKKPAGTHMIEPAELLVLQRVSRKEGARCERQQRAEQTHVDHRRHDAKNADSGRRSAQHRSPEKQRRTKRHTC